MEFLKTFPRLAAAALFAATASTAVVVSEAANAGAPAAGISASAAQPAAAAEITIGIGYGPHRYPRYAWRNGGWIRYGYYNGYAPGYIPGGYYVGWGPPRYAYSHPVYGYRGYYAGHPFDARRPYNPYYRR